MGGMTRTTSGGILRQLAAAALCLAAVLVTVPAFAQQRPLVTQDPEAIGAGQVLLEGGFEYGTDIFFPASGLTGNLFRIPQVGVSVGVSPIAEFQLSGGPYDHLSITSRSQAPLTHMLTATGSSTHDVEDIVIGAKVRLLSETAGRPAIGFRFATKLPNAGNEKGLGLDTTDFYASLLFGKTVQSFRIVGNFGFGILGDPTRGDSQNDVVTYGFSLARALTSQIDVVGELNGRVNTRSGTPPPGTETRSALRAGTRFTVGGVRLDAGIILGFTERDPAFGVTAGVTYMFKAFDLK